MPVKTRSMIKREQEIQEPTNEIKINITNHISSSPKITYRKHIEYVVNLTLGEYFVSSCIKNREDKMRELFVKLTPQTSIIKQSIGTSRWNKNDNIKLIPNQDKLLCKYVRENYSSVWIHTFNC